MKKQVTLTLLFSVLLLPLFAQTGQPAQVKPNFVVGKELTNADSALVRQLFFEGLHQKVVQNYQLAADYFNRVVAIDPANDASMYELAAIYHSRNQEEEAEDLLRNAVTVQPDNKWYWSMLADLYKKTNNVSQLGLVLEELIRLAPETEDYYLDKVNVLTIQNKYSEANAEIDRFEKHFGTSDDLAAARKRVLLRQGKPEKAAAEMEKDISAHPQNISGYVELAEIYSKAGNREKAIAILKQGTKADPANAALRLNLADNYRALNRFEDAFIELKVAFADPNFSVDEKVRIVLSFFPQFADFKARAYAEQLAYIITQTHPDEAKAFSLYGDVLFQEQKYTEAAASYRRALQLNDQVYQIWEQLVRIELSESRFKEAIADAEAALAIFPNQAAMYLYNGLAYAQSHNHLKAVANLKIASGLQSEDKEVREQIYSGLGDSYNALKRYAESDKAYETALELNPVNSYTLNNYAYYLSLRGENLAKAEQMSRRSIELDPGNAALEDTYAWILFRLKRYDEARTWIEKALLSSKQPGAVQLEHYGDILYFSGEKVAAVQQWQKARAAGAKSERLEKKINEKKYIE